MTYKKRRKMCRGGEEQKNDETRANVYMRKIYTIVNVLFPPRTLFPSLSHSLSLFLFLRYTLSVHYENQLFKKRIKSS